MPRENTIHPHVADEFAYLFTADDGGATEHEYLLVLQSLIRALKPRRVLETGTWTGSGTVALFEAMASNGFGDLHTVDLSADALDRARRRVDEDANDWGMDRIGSAKVHYHASDSLTFIKAQTEPFGFAFLDSALPLRALELEALFERDLLAPGGVAAIHDTSRLRIRPNGQPDPDTAEFWGLFERRVRRRFEPSVIELPLSRGLTLVQGRRR